jgi:hypothetical protein
LKENLSDSYDFPFTWQRYLKRKLILAEVPDAPPRTSFNDKVTSALVASQSAALNESLIERMALATKIAPRTAKIRLYLNLSRLCLDLERLPTGVKILIL